MSMYKCEDCGEWIGMGEPHRECAAVIRLKARVAELEQDMAAPFSVSIEGEGPNDDETFRRRAVARINRFRDALGGLCRSDDELIARMISRFSEGDAAKARVAELEAERDELKAKVEDAEFHLHMDCPCCGQTAASWFVSDGDDLECGCDGQISCDSETPPYVNAYDCDCDGDGDGKPSKRKDGE